MIVFLVHSIYHIFYALSIASLKNKSKIVCSSSIPDRYDSIFEIITEVFGIEVIKLTHNDTPSKFSKSDLTLIDNLKKEKLDEFVIFNQDNLLAIFLAHHFHKKGALVSLAQDGTKAYAKILKLAILYRLNRTKNLYKFLKLNKFKVFPFFISLRYADQKFIDKIYATYTSTTTSVEKEKEDVNLTPTVLDAFITLISQNEIDFEKNSVFYASSLLNYNADQLQKEIEILSHLNRKFFDFQKIIKVHPRVHQMVSEELQKNANGWIFIQDIFPAELILNKLKQYYLFSAYSSVVLFSPKVGHKTKKFWLYPLYEGLLKPLTYTRINIPSKDIIVINSFEELKNLELK